MDLKLVLLGFEMADSLLPVCGENIFVLAGQALVNLSMLKGSCQLLRRINSRAAGSWVLTYIGPRTGVELGGSIALRC